MLKGSGASMVEAAWQR
jgi:hypothetical protein